MKFRHHTFEVIASICLRLKYEPLILVTLKQHQIHLAQQEAYVIHVCCINPPHSLLPDVRVEDIGAENVRVTRTVDMRRVILSRDIIVMKID